jgi:transcriptional regulator with XRE-family HTH domain
MRSIKLTNSERFILARRRLDMSREDYANKFNMTVYRVIKIESGFSKNFKVAVLLKPKIHEIAFILRKRKRLKVNELAKLLKVSKQTILNREAGRRDPIPSIEFLYFYKGDIDEQC